MISRVHLVKYSILSTPRPLSKIYPRSYFHSDSHSSSYSRGLFKGKQFWEDQQRRQNTSGSVHSVDSSSTKLFWSAVVGALLAVPIALCASVDSDDSQAVTVADKLYKEGHKRECLDYLEKYFENKQGKVPVEILWRLSRAHYDVGTMASELHEESVDLKYHASKCYELALQAVKLCETGSESALAADRGAAYRWAGLSVSFTKGTDAKTSIETSYAMRDYFEKAIKEDPKEPMNHHVLGLWTYSRANYSWVERQVISWLVAAPPVATYEEALNHFLRAEETQPGFSKSNRYMIASCYEELGNIQEFKKWLKLTLDMPNNNREDHKAHMLASMSRRIRGIKWDNEKDNEEAKETEKEKEEIKK